MIAESKKPAEEVDRAGASGFYREISYPGFGSAEPPCDVAPLLFLLSSAKFLPNFFSYLLLFREYFVKLFSNYKAVLP
jgi:hypothetical protein